MDEYFKGNMTNKWTDRDGESSIKQQTPPNIFLHFCDLILNYEKYSPRKQEMDNSVYSPESSERTNDSFSSESNSSFGSNTEGAKPQDLDDSNSYSEGDDEAWDLITCHCMKPFAGRPMIECMECGAWIHMSCAKIRRKNVPDEFVCQVCREARAITRRSERIRTDDKRI